MLGYTGAELGRMTIVDVAPPELAEAAERGFLELKRTGRQTRKTVLQKKTGERITVLLDAVGLPEGQYMAFCKDITEQENLAREKERYYIAFQAMTQPIIFTDPRGTILEINAAFADMYGYSREESIGKTPKLLNPGKDIYLNLGYTEEEYAATFEGLWQNIRDPARGSWEGIVINRKKNGSLAWVNLIVNAIFDAEGKVTSVIGLPIDITTSREMEDKNRVQLYQTIADLAELRDNETGNHMKRVGIFARLLAKSCGMNEKFCNDIEIFAPMHDIGKVGILDSILRAPRKLTAEEFEIMKNHTVLGHNIVKDKAGCEMAAEVTLGHHEKFDSTGYPQRLSGKDIPLSAHITAIADVYDALRSVRPYKDAWDHATTVDYIVKSAGTHFDPELIDLFIILHTKFAGVYDELKD
jgi:PAS domain S-box-containing protein